MFETRNINREIVENLGSEVALEESINLKKEQQ
jgi:hypothetical protein